MNDFGNVQKEVIGDLEMKDIVEVIKYKIGELIFKDVVKFKKKWKNKSN